jgi:hypothetical protein
MHDSDIFQWMKFGTAAFRLTGFQGVAGRFGPFEFKSAKVRRRLNLSPRPDTHSKAERRFLTFLGQAR